MGERSSSSELLPGTLDLLILRALVTGSMHGYGIAQRLKQRLLLNGWVKAEWGASENNRRARFYSLTAAGREQLVREHEEFSRMIGAIQKVLEMA
jgi:PadR family transcriptional regulator PadR